MPAGWVFYNTSQRDGWIRPLLMDDTPVWRQAGERADMPAEPRSVSSDQRSPRKLTRHRRRFLGTVAAVGLAVGLLFGFLPVTVHSSAGQTVNCGSAFIKATINILVAGADRVSAVSLESEGGPRGVFGSCDSLRGRNGAIAAASLAAGVVAVLVVALSRKSLAGRP